MTDLRKLAEMGHSIWYDFIRRDFLEGGELTRLIGVGLRGMTSNPSIFAKAIAGGADYDVSLRSAIRAGKSVEGIYEQLAVEDIRRAADLLLPVYDGSGGLDGYVSLEVSPGLARDTDGTVREAKRLHLAVERPNLMIKVPATEEGIPAISSLIGLGINVNVTLLFDREVYRSVAEAYLCGLEELSRLGPGVPGGHPVSAIASVASFFVSRIDAVIDPLLEERGKKELCGRIAIANAKLAYADSLAFYKGERWEKLASLGARRQRLLWASTSTKNPRYPDTHYVDELIGADTVNTVPPATFAAFLDHGRISDALSRGGEQARRQIGELADLGIDLSAITRKLLGQGVAAFQDAFDSLLESIAEKKRSLEDAGQDALFDLGAAAEAADGLLTRIEERRIIDRIWECDHTVWKDDPAEISNRLGWLCLPETMRDAASELAFFAEELRTDGFKRAVLLGMGGSSLAPEVYRKLFGVREGHLDLLVLDSTDPGAVLAVERTMTPEETLFIVSTKSGGTVETLSFMKYYYGRMIEALGETRARRHFIAVTDPGSGLEELALRLGFRRIFRNDPNIGGRYSALSYFGLVPAALLGIDPGKLLRRAQLMAGSGSPARLGAVMGELASRGRDKLTLVTTPSLAPFGPWVEQLIAESTGKEGRGIVPVTGEALLSPEHYGGDRFFVYLRLEGETGGEKQVEALHRAGHPKVTLTLRDRYDLGGEIFRWEMATAVAGFRLGINPFDQPDVESAKKLTREMMAAYGESGALPESAPSLEAEGIRVYSDIRATTVAAQLTRFLAPADEQGSRYIALQAYLQPTPETDRALQELRTRIQARWPAATTVGYGPRFLHSTGQLHKGDGGGGLFIQLTADMPEDRPIPDEPGSAASSVSFGVLKTAQAMGDRKALMERGRRVIRFHLGGDVLGALKKLESAADESGG